MKNFLKKLGAVALPIAITYISPASLANVAGGAFAKHVVPDDKFQNKNIPLASIGLTALYHYVAGVVQNGGSNWLTPIMPAVHMGTAQGGMGWALHQSIKVPAQQLGLQVNGKSL